jgi:predicted nuclease of predicted toxin-antitoxin system
LNLLLDENLSPRLIPRLTALGIFAQHNAYLGLSGKSDSEIWLYALEHDQIVVTINAKDFLNLAAGSEVHPGLIILRGSGLSMDEQWTRLEPVIMIVREAENQGRDLINRVIEVFSPDHRAIRDLPA